MSRLRTSLAALALAGTATAPAFAHEPRATLEEGEIVGVHQGGVEAFLGIPFAAPPVGANRWRSPQAVQPWTEPRDANTFGANCIQPLGQGDYGPWTHEYVVTENFSEDCLFLNVWRPSGVAEQERLPVYVWIHGGGFVAGSGAVPIYDGHNLATRDMIVVTLNYRLGALGFLAHPEISAEAGDGPKSNFGLQDQIAALEWVQRNIAALGGDPDNVTIAGQSAGAIAVHSLVASPAAKGLFARAIAQAGLPVAGRTSTPLADAEKAGAAYMEQLGQDSLSGLRALPATAFLPQPGTGRPFRFGIVLDDILLGSDPSTAVTAGTANDVPMLVGQNADEALGGPPASGEISVEDWNTALDGAFGPHAEAIGSLYPAATGEQRAASLRQIQRDRAYADIWLWGIARARTNNSPLYVYLFDHVEPGPVSNVWRSFHSNEIPYVFGTLDKAPERRFTFEDWKVSLTMSQIWANFARNGIPSGDDLGTAPAFEADNPERIRIRAVAEAETMLSPEKRAAYAAFVEDGGVLSPMFR